MSVSNLDSPQRDAIDYVERNKQALLTLMVSIHPRSIAEPDARKNMSLRLLRGTGCAL